MIFGAFTYMGGYVRGYDNGVDTSNDQKDSMTNTIMIQEVEISRLSIKLLNEEGKSRTSTHGVSRDRERIRPGDLN